MRALAPAAPDEAERAERLEAGRKLFAQPSTFVIGVAIPPTPTPVAPDLDPDGVDVPAYLDMLAQAGGRPNPIGMHDWYAGDSAPQLAAALGAVLFAARSCMVPVPQTPMFPELLAVEVEGGEVPRVRDCSAGDGWTLLGDRIQFCGAWCDPVKQALTAIVHYQCP